MRLFFAIPIPEEIIAAVTKAQDELRAVVGEDGVRWTKPKQFHYTLKFLGETPILRAEKAVETAQGVCEAQTPFDLTLGGVGAFPNPQRPSVLWLGATAGAEALTDLAARLDAALVALRFPHEKKPVKAHLTLARIKTYAGETAAARALKTVQFDELGSFRIFSFVLMRSLLKPSGSEYNVVKEFGFVKS